VALAYSASINVDGRPPARFGRCQSPLRTRIASARTPGEGKTRGRPDGLQILNRGDYVLAEGSPRRRGRRCGGNPDQSGAERTIGGGTASRMEDDSADKPTKNGRTGSHQLTPAKEKWTIGVGRWYGFTAATVRGLQKLPFLVTLERLRSADRWSAKFAPIGLGAFPVEKKTSC